MCTYSYKVVLLSKWIKNFRCCVVVCQVKGYSTTSQCGGFCLLTCNIFICKNVLVCYSRQPASLLKKHQKCPN